jgi:hypothetical protein
MSQPLPILERELRVIEILLGNELLEFLAREARKIVLQGLELDST